MGQFSNACRFCVFSVPEDRFSKLVFKLSSLEEQTSSAVVPGCSRAPGRFSVNLQILSQAPGVLNESSQEDVSLQARCGDQEAAV